MHAARLAEADANLRPKPKSGRPGDPTSVPVEGASAKVRICVALGDDHYQLGMKHLGNADRDARPKRWAEENKKALKEFMNAWKCYGSAQEHWRTIEIPQTLLDRFRSAQMRLGLCRRRAFGSR